MISKEVKECIDGSHIPLENFMDYSGQMWEAIKVQTEENIMHHFLRKTKGVFLFTFISGFDSHPIMFTLKYVKPYLNDEMIMFKCLMYISIYIYL